MDLHPHSIGITWFHYSEDVWAQKSIQGENTDTVALLPILIEIILRYFYICINIFGRHWQRSKNGKSSWNIYKSLEYGESYTSESDWNLFWKSYVPVKTQTVTPRTVSCGRTDTTWVLKEGSKYLSLLAFLLTRNIRGDVIEVSPNGIVDILVEFL